MSRIPFIFLVLLVNSLSATAQLTPRGMQLDGSWFFRADSMRIGVTEGWYLDSIDRTGWDLVQVPSYWKEYPGLATYDGWGWFHKTFIVDRMDEPISIHFAGVDDDAVVWVNDLNVGEHSGFSEPFTVDLGGTVKPGVNTISVLVKDTGGGGGIYKPVTVIATRLVDELVKSPYFDTPALKSANWVRDAVIYSVYLRSASPEGTFAGLEKRLPELKDLGVTMLWLLPIHPVGLRNRKGTLGSPYAVQDYYGINPEFGTMQDFKHLLASVKKLGMRLIIDLVANHTSWDSKLIVEHPEWFTRDQPGNIVPPNDDWTDVADLNYSNPGLRRYMIDMMRWWVRDVGINGFRCDVAEMVPTDFWDEARRQLNKIAPVMMLSEGSIPEHHVKAFDLTYSWNIYDALDPLLRGKRPVALIDQILRSERLQFPTGSLRMRFTTNHDKNAWDEPAILKFGTEGLKLATVLVNTLPGVPMLYTGEEVANDRKLSLFEKVGVDWNRPRDMEALWKSLIFLRKEHLALSRGDMVKIPSTPERDVYSFVRAAGRDKVLVVLNFSAEPCKAVLSVPVDRLFPVQKLVRMKEYFGGAGIAFGPDQMIEFPLEGDGYKIFILEPPAAKKGK